MAIGKRPTQRQTELWVCAESMPTAPRHVFYERLNEILAAANFDPWIEELCAPYYAQGGRPSVAPGIYFRMILIGYFEDIDSQRGIAWRCQDSLSLRKFLGRGLEQTTPDHSSLTRARQRLPGDLFTKFFKCILAITADHGLLAGKTVGVDSTTVEANAAMRSIVRKDSGEDWEDYLRRLAANEGIELKTKAEIAAYDQQRKKNGQKKASNDEWSSRTDPDAAIMKMKDGSTHLGYKAEHAVDLETEVILAAEIYHGEEADSQTLVETVEIAEEQMQAAAGDERAIHEVVADKGYHSAANAQTEKDPENWAPQQGILSKVNQSIGRTGRWRDNDARSRQRSRQRTVCRPRAATKQPRSWRASPAFMPPKLPPGRSCWWRCRQGQRYRTPAEIYG